MFLQLLEVVLHGEVQLLNGKNLNYTEGLAAWHPKYRDIDKDMIRISHEEGLAVNVWTVNEKYEMFKMIEYGVDGIITDYPLRLKKLCEDEGINWF